MSGLQEVGCRNKAADEWRIARDESVGRDAGKGEQQRDRKKQAVWDGTADHGLQRSLACMRVGQGARNDVQWLASAPFLLRRLLTAPPSTSQAGKAELPPKPVRYTTWPLANRFRSVPLN